MKRKNIEKVASSIYDKLLAERNDNRDCVISDPELIDLIKSKLNTSSNKANNEGIVIILSGDEMIFPNKNLITLGDIKNLKSLC